MCKQKNLTYYFVVNPRKGQIWFDGYNGQQAIILDDFYGWIEPATLFRMLDIYTMQLPIKGGFTWAFWNYVFITSNSQPQHWYKPEIMDRIDKDAYYRRLHKICLVEKVYDEELNDTVTKFYFDKNEDGVIPVERAPCLSTIRYCNAVGDMDTPPSFFNEDQLEAYRRTKLDKLKTAAEVKKGFVIPQSPDEHSSDSGNKNIDKRVATIEEIYDVDEGTATTFTRYLDNEYPALATQEEKNPVELDSEEEELLRYDGKHYEWRRAEGRHSSVDSDEDIPPPDIENPDDFDQDNDDTPTYGTIIDPENYSDAEEQVEVDEPQEEESQDMFDL